MFDLKLPIKLSLYIGIPSIALFVYLFQKSNKDSEEEEFNYERAIKSNQFIVEIKVPAECVRSIIGSQGCNVKEIQRKTNTRINLKDKEGANENDMEKTLVIRGSRASIQHAEIEIKKIILDMPMLLTEEYYVPEYACGRIIGRGGVNIKEMSIISNCKIKINDKINRKLKNESSITPKDLKTSMLKNESSCSLQAEATNIQKKIVTIIGSSEQILHAKELIMGKINEEDIIREKKNNKFQKLNSNSSNKISSMSNQDLQKNDSIENNSTELNLEMPKQIDLDKYLDNESSIDVFVSAVAHPFAFWVQVINEDSKKLDKLIDDMNRFYTKNTDNFYKNISELKVGSLVAAKFNKKSWHRAEIKGFKATEDGAELIDVYYVDFGDSAYLEFEDICHLRSEFYEIELQAIECSLDMIKPCEDYWSEEAIDHFEELTHSCKWKPIHLKKIKEEIYEIDNCKIKKPFVILTDKDKNFSISDKLIESGFAIALNKTEQCMQQQV